MAISQRDKFAHMGILAEIVSKRCKNRRLHLAEDYRQCTVHASLVTNVPAIHGAPISTVAVNRIFDQQMLADKMDFDYASQIVSTMDRHLMQEVAARSPGEDISALITLTGMASEYDMDSNSFRVFKKDARSKVGMPFTYVRIGGMADLQKWQGCLAAFVEAHAACDRLQSTGGELMYESNSALSNSAVPRTEVGMAVEGYLMEQRNLRREGERARLMGEPNPSLIYNSDLLYDSVRIANMPTLLREPAKPGLGKRLKK